jgi:uncharacterized Fe-S cluster protein YjdI
MIVYGLSVTVHDEKRIRGKKKIFKLDKGPLFSYTPAYK